MVAPERGVGSVAIVAQVLALLVLQTSAQTSGSSSCDSSSLTYQKVANEVLVHLSPSGDIFKRGSPDIAYNCIAYGRTPSRVREAVVTGTLGLGFEVVTLHYRCDVNTGRLQVSRVPTFMPDLQNATVDCASCNPLASQMCLGCDATCVDGSCFGPSADECCNFLQDGECVASCTGNRVGDNATKLCGCAPNWAGISCSECTLECRNNGTADATCTSCECSTNYRGTNCEMEQPCLSNPCGENGICINNDIHLSTPAVNAAATPYSCVCRSPFTGNHCDVEIDPCTSSPCANGGHCRGSTGDLPGFSSFVCECAEGFVGEHCTVELPHPCEVTDPSALACLNSGSCLPTIGRGFVCNCTAGYTGQRCESGPCEANPQACRNGGVCRNLLEGQYSCDCLESFTGPSCQVDMASPCYSDPCQYMGTCTATAGAGFNCSCPPGFTGNHCQMGPCEINLSPCLHGSTCVNNATSENPECECIEGFAGPTCGLDLIDPCNSLPKPCADFSRCFVNAEGEAACDCPPGFSGVRCEVGPCQNEPVPCLHGGTCQNHANSSLSCDCLEGHLGERCEFIPGHPCVENPCSNGTCQPLQGMDYKCECPVGFTGLHCDQGPCETMPQPCQHNASCVNGEGGLHDCVCLDGFAGQQCEFDLSDPCHSSPCPGEASCVTRTTDRHICLCPPGVQDPACHVPPCEAEPNACRNNGSCVTSPEDTVQCVCLDGYGGERCAIDLSDPCMSTPCPSNASCQRQDGGDVFRCLCPEGSKDPECYQPPCVRTPDVCRNGAQCVDGPQDEVVCMCLDGYSGHDCSFDVRDPCLSGPCPTNATCEWIAGGIVEEARCHCPPDSADPNCYVPPCLRTPLVCRNGGQCVNSDIDTATCLCLDGYSGHDCSFDVFDPCASAPCPTNSTCEWVSTGVQDETRCHCPPGDADPTCYQLPCVRTPLVCRNGGSCVNTPADTATCVCLDGYSGMDCSHNLADPCYSSPCPSNATCVAIDNTTTQCHCPPNSTHPSCHMPPCDATPGVCQNGGRCENGPNETFACICLDGYQGKLCDMDLTDPCLTAPCPPRASCVGNLTSFLCMCPPDVVDPLCYNVPCDENPAVCQHGGLCGQLGSGRSSCICLDGWTGVHCENTVVAPPSLMPCLDYDPCKNGGLCVADPSASAGMRCECPPKFSGDTCEFGTPPHGQDLCLIDPMPCHPTGDCRYMPRNNSKTCDCLEGFNGLSCEVITLFSQPSGGGTHNACNPNPCWADGLCVPSGNGYECKCPPGRSGPHCEGGGPCSEPNACMNGGVCMPNGLGHVCDCVTGYTGEKCEVVLLSGDFQKTGLDPCWQSPCFGQATCVSHRDGFECLCPPGMTGASCSVSGDAPCRVNPCANDARCVPDLANQYVCECLPGYTGRKCDIILSGIFPESWPTLSRGKGSQTPGDPVLGQPGVGAGLGSSLPASNAPVPPQAQPIGTPGHLPGNPANQPPPNTDPLLPPLPDTGVGGGIGLASPCPKENNPCGNNGRCVDRGDGYQCDCPRTFSGVQCLAGTGGQCGGRTCENGGRCIHSQHSGTFKCSCPQGLAGAGCEVNIVPTSLMTGSTNPCDASPCNGGVCSPVFGGFICQCVEPATGPLCQQSSPPTRPVHNTQFKTPPGRTRPDLPPQVPLQPRVPDLPGALPGLPPNTRQNPPVDPIRPNLPPIDRRGPSPIYVPPLSPYDKHGPPVHQRPDPLSPDPVPLYTPDLPQMGIHTGNVAGSPGQKTRRPGDQVPGGMPGAFPMPGSAVGNGPPAGAGGGQPSDQVNPGMTNPGRNGGTTGVAGPNDIGGGGVVVPNPGRSQGPGTVSGTQGQFSKSAGGSRNAGGSLPPLDSINTGGGGPISAGSPRDATGQPRGGGNHPIPPGGAGAGRPVLKAGGGNVGNGQHDPIQGNPSLGGPDGGTRNTPHNTAGGAHIIGGKPWQEGGNPGASPPDTRRPIAANPVAGGGNGGTDPGPSVGGLGPGPGGLPPPSSIGGSPNQGLPGKTVNGHPGTPQRVGGVPDQGTGMAPPQQPSGSPPPFSGQPPSAVNGNSGAASGQNGGNHGGPGAADQSGRGSTSPTNIHLPPAQRNPGNVPGGNPNFPSGAGGPLFTDAGTGFPGKSTFDTGVPENGNGIGADSLAGGVGGGDPTGGGIGRGEPEGSPVGGTNGQQGGGSAGGNPIGSATGGQGGGVGGGPPQAGATPGQPGGVGGGMPAGGATGGPGGSVGQGPPTGGAKGVPAGGVSGDPPPAGATPGQPGGVGGGMPAGGATGGPGGSVGQGPPTGGAKGVPAGGVGGDRPPAGATPRPGGVGGGMPAGGATGGPGGSVGQGPPTGGAKGVPAGGVGGDPPPAGATPGQPGGVGGGMPAGGATGGPGGGVGQGPPTGGAKGVPAGGVGGDRPPAGATGGQSGGVDGGTPPGSSTGEPRGGGGQSPPTGGANGGPVGGGQPGGIGGGGTVGSANGGRSGGNLFDIPSADAGRSGAARPDNTRTPVASDSAGNLPGSRNPFRKPIDPDVTVDLPLHVRTTTGSPAGGGVGIPGGSPGRAGGNGNANKAFNQPAANPPRSHLVFGNPSGSSAGGPGNNAGGAGGNPASNGVPTGNTGGTGNAGDATGSVSPGGFPVNGGGPPSSGNIRNYLPLRRGFAYRASAMGRGRGFRTGTGAGANPGATPGASGGTGAGGGGRGFGTGTGAGGGGRGFGTGTGGGGTRSGGAGTGRRGFRVGAGTGNGQGGSAAAAPAVGRNGGTGQAGSPANSGRTTTVVLPARGFMAGFPVSDGVTSRPAAGRDSSAHRATGFNVVGSSSQEGTVTKSMGQSCRTKPCENGGLCATSSDDDDDDRSYRCQCAGSWQGTTCSDCLAPYVVDGTQCGLYCVTPGAVVVNGVCKSVVRAGASVSARNSGSRFAPMQRMDEKDMTAPDVAHRVMTTNVIPAIAIGLGTILLLSLIVAFVAWRWLRRRRARQLVKKQRHESIANSDFSELGARRETIESIEEEAAAAAPDVFVPEPAIPDVPVSPPTSAVSTVNEGYTEDDSLSNGEDTTNF